MIDWVFVEAVRGSVFDILRTVIFFVGAVVAYIQLKEQYRLRRLDVLSSLNDRLSKCGKANRFIYNSDKGWDDLDMDTKYEYQTYVAVFEDIGLARSTGIITKDDFIRSYGGRYKNLLVSGTLPKYMVSAHFERKNFENLQLISNDIGMPLWIEQ